MITRSARSVSIAGYKNHQLVPCVARLYKYESSVQMSVLALKTVTINEYSIISDIERSNDSIINERATRTRIHLTCTEIVADYLRYTSFRTEIIV